MRRSVERRLGKDGTVRPVALQWRRSQTAALSTSRTPPLQAPAAAQVLMPPSEGGQRCLGSCRYVMRSAGRR